MLGKKHCGWPIKNGGKFSFFKNSQMHGLPGAPPPTHTYYTDGKWTCLITLQLYEWCRHLRDKEYIVAAGGISTAWCLIGCCWRLWSGEVSSILEEMLIKHYQDNTTGRASAVETDLPVLGCFYALGAVKSSRLFMMGNSLDQIVLL